VDPVPDPLLLRKSGSAGDRTRDLCICSQKLWPLDHRGGPRPRIYIWHPVTTNSPVIITDMIVLCKKKTPVSNWWFSFPVAIKNDIGKENWGILTNKEIYASVKKLTIIETIRTNRLRWFGHVQRMEENRIPKRVLYMNLGTTRLSGRPRNRW